MLKRLYKAAKVQESAEPCLALATEHQANAEMKVRKFDTKMFTSFCVLARQMHENKEVSCSVFLVVSHFDIANFSGSPSGTTARHP